MQTASGTTLGMADFFFLKQPLVVGSLSHISDLLNPGLCCVDKGLGRERADGGLAELLRSLPAVLCLGDESHALGSVHVTVSVPGPKPSETQASWWRLLEKAPL